MGKKDEYQYDYLDDYERFADQVNGALFGGRQVVKPDELEPADAQTVYLGKEAGKRENFGTIADKTRTWQGRRIHIIALQNQSYADYRMVLRNMLSESIGYHRQWKMKQAAHRKAKDLKTGTDAFLSGMTKEEKFTPIITLVVYCGTEHGWGGAKCLHDLLDIDDEMKEFISNYKLNLYDCHEHDTFDEYHTGLRQLFETIRYSKDKEQLKRVIEKNKDTYSSIDSETRELLDVMANVRIPEEYKIMEQGKERYNMCKAIEDMRLESKMEGIQEQLIQLVCKKLQKNKPVEVIAEELEEDRSEIEKIIAAQKRVGNYDAEQIRMVMVE